jgi:predicted RNA-binding Zn-ribbon protein involved in translation (DUF1610 family)
MRTCTDCGWFEVSVDVAMFRLYFDCPECSKPEAA